MKYSTITPYWHNFDGVSILTDDTDRLQGFLKPIGSQLHREYIRALKTGVKKPKIRPP